MSPGAPETHSICSRPCTSLTDGGTPTPLSSVQNPMQSMPHFCDDAKQKLEEDVRGVLLNLCQQANLQSGAPTWRWSLRRIDE